VKQLLSERRTMQQLQCTGFACFQSSELLILSLSLYLCFNEHNVELFIILGAFLS
jgi:hypothetical protein